MAWEFVPSETTLWACRDGEPVDSVFEGPGEVFWAMDSNVDGIAEVVIGGTTVGGGGGTVYSFLDEVIVPIRSPLGPLVISSGHVLNGFVGFGCAGGRVVTLEAESVDDLVMLTTVVYEIERERALIVDLQRVTEPAGVNPLDTAYELVEASTAELAECGATLDSEEVASQPQTLDEPPQFPLAGSNALIRLELLSPSEQTCEVDKRKPHLLLETPTGMESPWMVPGGDAVEVFWIERNEFVSTSDGRFAYLDSFTCSHEGPIKELVEGRYAPDTGVLLEIATVMIPEQFHRERWGFPIQHPDALSVDQDGSIVAWFGADGIFSPLLVSSP